MKLRVSHSIDFLKQFALETGSAFQEEYGAALLEFNPDLALGTIRAFHIMPGMSTVIQDFTFHEDFSFCLDEKLSNTLYLMYIIEGYVLHKFDSDKEYIRLDSKQNIIVGSSDHEVNRIIWPSGVKIRMVVTDIYRDSLDKTQNFSKGFFSTGLQGVFDTIALGKSYRHSGPMNSHCFQYFNILFDHTKIDFIGRLKIEAAILNVVAMQFEAYMSYDNALGYECGLDKVELKKVLELSEYIADNLSKQERIADFVIISGLHAKKLQLGFRYYFRESVNEFVHSARMAKAKELIEITDFSLNEICTEIGFESRSYFSRTFSERYGTSPAEYREHLNTSPLFFSLFIGLQR